MITHTRILFLLIALATLLLTSCTSKSVIDPSRRKNVAPEKKLCVFRSDIDEEYNYEIYLLRTDKGPIGEAEELVLKLTETAAPAAEVFPTISRDGNTIVYCSSLNDMGSNPFFPDFDIFMVKVDTGEITPLTDTGREREYAPSISADGKILTYMVGSFMKSNADLVMMNLDNPEERILIQENLTQKAYPRITADGEMVIYSAPTGATKKMDVFLVNLETREVRNLTRTPEAEEYYPDISDDKQIIVYQLKLPDAEEELPVASQGGTLIAQAEDEEPESSDESSDEGTDESDGEAVEEESDEDGESEETGEVTATPSTPEPEKKNNWEIWVLNLANREEMQATDNDFNDVFPVISGDGTWVVYTSAREDLSGDGQEEFMIYMTDLITGEEVLVSSLPFHHDTVEISW